MQNATTTKAARILTARTLMTMTVPQYTNWLRAKWHPVNCQCGHNAARIMGA